jgi:hypothetical protein
MCSTKFTVHAEFTVHLANLSVNSTGLPAKSAGTRRLGISLFIFSIKWISVGFYRIRLVFKKTDEIGGGQFFSVYWFFKHWLCPTLAALG